MSRPLITRTERRGDAAYSSIECLPAQVLLVRLLGVAPQLALLLLMGVAVVGGVQAFQSEIGNPWSEIALSIPRIALVTTAGVLLLAMVEIIERRWQPPLEYTRKLAHVGAGAIALFMPVLFSTHWPVLLLAAMFSAALLISRRSGWLISLQLPARRGKGDILFLWAVYLVFLLADGNRVIFQVPVLVLTVGDAAAALIGQRYGRTRYHLGENTRTVEGSMAFVVTAFLSVLILLFVSVGMPLSQSAVLSLVVATVAGSVEALTTRGLDNASVPIGTLLLLTVFLE